jgi:hypothetical protein
MNKLLLIITLLLLLSFKTDSTKWVIKQKGDIVSVDKLGKIYQVTDNAIVKYNENGKKIANYSILNSGKITLIDTKNPLQSLLFFEQQQDIIILDNMLGEANSFNLSNYFEWINLVCISNRDNALWLYNISGQELIKTDINLNVISKSSNLAQILSLDLTPSQLMEVNETVFLFDKKNGLILFDIFGNYKKKIVLKNAEKIFIDNNLVYYLSNNTIHYYNLKSFNKDVVFESDKNIVNFCVFGDNLILQTESNLTSLIINKKE